MESAGKGGEKVGWWRERGVLGIRERGMVVENGCIRRMTNVSFLAYLRDCGSVRFACLSDVARRGLLAFKLVPPSSSIAAERRDDQNCVARVS